MGRSQRITEVRLTPRRLAISRLLSPPLRSCFISGSSLPASCSIIFLERFTEAILRSRVFNYVWILLLEELFRAVLRATQTAHRSLLCI